MTTTKLSRRDIFSAGAAGIAATSLGSRFALAKRSQRSLPNVLWLVSEDNGPFIGAYGDKLAHTPVIDRLAQRGLLYTHAYSNAPVCSVSRFGVLTGVYPQSCGAVQNHRTRVVHPEGAKGYPTYLRNAGYYCTNNSKTDYNTTIDPATLWDACGAKAHWRNRPQGAPFMAVFNFGTTHSSSVFESLSGRVKPDDVTVPAYLPDTEAIRRDIATYYNRIEVMDGQIGQRLAELEADSLAEDTIVFYFSDHGGVAPRSKQFCYENGLRVPLIVSIPEKFSQLSPARRGSKVDSIVTYIDLAPTVLALAGIAKPLEMVGRPFLGQLAPSAQKYAFAARNRIDERIDFVRTVTDGRYRYIRNYMPHRPWGLHDGYMWKARGWQEWERRYLSGALSEVQARFFKLKPFEELYDLATDPDEIHNLVTAPGARAKCEELRTALDQHMLSTNDTGFIPEGATNQLQSCGTKAQAGTYPLQRIMEVAAAAARREVSSLGMFQESLADECEIVRYWAAQGLLLLGPQSKPAAVSLRKAAQEDESVYVRMVAAEAMGGLGEGSAAIDILIRILDVHPSLAVKQHVLNSLNALVNESAFERAIPSLQRWAQIEQKDIGLLEFDYWTVKSLARYLLALFGKRYQPAEITFPGDFVDRNYACLL